MEGAKPYAPLLDYVSEITAPGAFTLVDLGCSGGLDRVWRRLGARLRAVGIDPNVEEVERLRTAERNPAIQYVNAFAGLPPDHPFARKQRSQPRGPQQTRLWLAGVEGERSAWSRLSTAAYLELTAPQRENMSGEQKQASNLWPEVKLADPAKPLFVPTYLTENGIRSVDFVKIDVDGKDFELLNSFDGVMDSLQILAFALEVIFYGSDDQTEHTFHNTDRFMKSRGFELFNLTVQRYSAAALPSRFIFNVPGPTESGRVLVGDALYVRDLAGGHYEDFAATLSPDKILNLAIIFSVFQLPDCAAEVVLKYRGLLSKVCNVNQVLDALAAHAQNRTSSANYQDYVERFRRDPRSFLAARNPFLRSVARALSEWKKGYLTWKSKLGLPR